MTKHPAYRTRDAARVILLDANNNVLMLRGHDEHNPTRHWWFTVGGGLDAGESHRQAAVREVFEETGITLEEGDLVGPVMFRSAIFDFKQNTSSNMKRSSSRTLTQHQCCPPPDGQMSNNALSTTLPG